MAGERELAVLLREELRSGVTRNLAQTRAGGHDLDGLPFALELKRTRRATPAHVRGWWAQAEGQAEQAGKPPALVYREDRQDWRVVVPLAAIRPGLGPWPGVEWTATLSLAASCAVVSQGLAT